MPRVSTPAVGSTVLLVDDNPGNLGVLFECLEGQGYRVLAALSGDEALAQVDRAQPDLILLDVVMPGLDGFETCRRIKRRDKTRDTPVIFMSALTDPDDKVRAFATGAVDYVTKPFSNEEVLARVSTQLSLRRLRREIEQRNEILEQQRNELGKRNKDLGAFAQMVAHDLNNRLFRIISDTEMLIDQLRVDGSPVGVADLEVILDTCEAIGERFKALVLLGGVSEQQVEPRPVDMGAIVARVKRELLTQCRACDARIEEPDGWPTALGYAPWVEQVWLNYISNGLKYGGRPARLTLGAETEGDDRVRFWIRDNGDGIPEHAEAMVFEPFTRLQTDRAPGHGLGLTIVSRIIDKLGGEVGVRPADEGGSEFFFTLPRVRSS